MKEFGFMCETYDTMLTFPRPRVVRTIPTKCWCDVPGTGTDTHPNPDCPICRGTGIKYIKEEEY